LLLFLDNRDSFTFNLVQAFQARGQDVLVRSSRACDLAEVLRLAPERVVLGPGPGGPADAGSSLEVARGLPQGVPLLGVCLGMQVLAQAFGGRVGRAREPVHGRAVAVEHDGRGLFRGLPSPARFVRYNSLAVLDEGLPPELVVSARAADGDVMGLRHARRPVEGVQFHPESILSEGGERLLENFLSPGARATTA